MTLTDRLTSPEMRERVARIIERADNERIPDGYAGTLPGDISDWGAYLADKTIACIAAALADME